MDSRSMFANKTFMNFLYAKITWIRLLDYCVKEGQINKHTFTVMILAWQNQTLRVDRFVPSRSSLAGIRQRWSLLKCYEPRTEHTHFKHKNYKKIINLTTQQRHIASRVEDVFEFEPKNRMSFMTRLMREDKDVSWPCTPRKKGFLCTSDGVLDLPGYKDAPFTELLDWNKDDVLVAALGRKYYKWSWKSQGILNSGIIPNNIFCCKFDPRGELLALGSTTVEIHHHEMTKCISSNRCQCIDMLEDYCYFTALDWSPAGNSFAAGCVNGRLSVFTRSAHLVRYEKFCSEAILQVKISPDARFVAISSLSDEFVRLLAWPSLTSYIMLGSGLAIKTITWHPWRSALLGIGAVTLKHRSVIALWSVPQAKEIRQTYVHPRNQDVDAMLFSPRSGELVMSLWNSERDPNAVVKKGDVGSRIIVMSDPDTVVDEWGETRYYLDRVRTMVFSPDGTKLATASIEEDLIIWNFLPEDKKKVINKQRFCALPVYIDETSNGFSLR